MIRFFTDNHHTIKVVTNKHIVTINTESGDVLSLAERLAVPALEHMQEQKLIALATVEAIEGNTFDLVPAGTLEAAGAMLDIPETTQGKIAYIRNTVQALDGMLVAMAGDERIEANTRESQIVNVLNYYRLPFGDLIDMASGYLDS